MRLFQVEPDEEQDRRGALFAVVFVPVAEVMVATWNSEHMVTFEVVSVETERLRELCGFVVDTCIRFGERDGFVDVLIDLDAVDYTV